MKISEVTIETIRSHLRIDGSDEDTTLTIILSASTSYIIGYTGIATEDLDNYEDLTIALLVLCSDMYENRLMTVQNDKVNKVVQSILDMHCLNLL